LFLLLCRRFLVWCSPIYPSLLIIAVIGALSGSYSLCSRIFRVLSWSISILFTVILFPKFHFLSKFQRSLIHFELIFIQDERLRSSFSLLHEDIQFSLHYLLKRLLSSIKYFGLLCQKSAGCSFMDLCLGLLFHWSSCLFLCQYSCCYGSVV
jgi:hypothetical protein